MVVVGGTLLLGGAIDWRIIRDWQGEAVWLLLGIVAGAFCVYCGVTGRWLGSAHRA